MAVPLASSASASRSLRMICSGEWRIRFIGSPPALSGENDSHIGWTSLRGAGQYIDVTGDEQSREDFHPAHGSHVSCLIRDIFNNPFSPVAFKRRWESGEV